MLQKSSLYYTLTDWLTYLEQLHPKQIDLGLERIRKVAECAGLLPFPLPVITVAGTNGKGSCAHFLECIFSNAGYRVGLYTSPHLLQYNERIRFNHCFATNEQLCQAFQVIEQLRGSISLTYFEFSTLAALKLFKDAKLDLVILEVGLGGRLDAVNILDADVALISSISLDHTEWLGDTCEKIAYEKLGILRRHKPCVLGDASMLECVMKQTQSLEVPLYYPPRNFYYHRSDSTWLWRSQQYCFDRLPVPRIELSNAALVLYAVELLRERFPVMPAVLDRALRTVFVPGRFQMIEWNSVTVILDVAHNPAASDLLAKKLQVVQRGKTLAVFAICADKDIHATLQPLIPIIDAWYVAPLPIERGAAPRTVIQCLEKFYVRTISAFTRITDAFLSAVAEATADDRIVVFGSFYTVSAVLRL